MVHNISNIACFAFGIVTGKWILISFVRRELYTTAGTDNTVRVDVKLLLVVMLGVVSDFTTP